MKQRDLGLVVGLATLLVGLLAWLWLTTSRESAAPAADVERPQVASPSVEPTRAATSVDAPTDTDPSAAPEREARGVAANAPQKGPTGSLVVRAVWKYGGAPAANVGVRLQRENGPLGLVAAQAKTDASGIARFANVDAVPMLVLGDRSGKARVLIAPGAANEVELALPAGARVTGRVTDPSGRSVSNAQIWILTSEDDWVAIGECDSAGRFRIEHVPYGRSLSATTRDLAPSAVKLGPSSYDDTVERDFELRGAAASLLGQVLNGEDQPVPNAVARLRFDTSGDWIATCDDEGRFTYHGVPPGEASLSVLTPHFAPAELRLNVELRARNEHIVRLEPGAEVSGVITLDGQPVADVEVRIQTGQLVPFECAGARTDLQGRYRMGGLAPGWHKFTASLNAPESNPNRERSGKSPAWATGGIVLIAGRTVIWNAELKRDE